MSNHVYYNHDDPRAYDGLEKKLQNAFEEAFPSIEKVCACTKCSGYGGWIMSKRENGKHLMASCNRCSGWGYIDATKEPADVKRNRLIARWRGHIVFERSGKSTKNTIRGYWRVLDKEYPEFSDLPKDDQELILIIANDSWQTGNFGGSAKEVVKNSFFVTTFID